MLFEVLEDQRDDWVVLTVIGELDLGAVPRVRHAVLRAIAAAERAQPLGLGPRSAQVVLDLSSVDFIDSSGLGVVLGTLRRVRATGGRLGVVPGPGVREVFALTRLDEILALGATVHDAIVAADEEPVIGETVSEANDG